MTQKLEISSTDQMLINYGKLTGSLERLIDKYKVELAEAKEKQENSKIEKVQLISAAIETQLQLTINDLTKILEENK